MLNLVSNNLFSLSFLIKREAFESVATSEAIYCLISDKTKYLSRQRFVADFEERFHFIFAFINKKHTLIEGPFTNYCSNNRLN